MCIAGHFLISLACCTSLTDSVVFSFMFLAALLLLLLLLLGHWCNYTSQLWYFSLLLCWCLHTYSSCVLFFLICFLVSEAFFSLPLLVFCNVCTEIHSSSTSSHVAVTCYQGSLLPALPGRLAICCSMLLYITPDSVCPLEGLCCISAIVLVFPPSSSSLSTSA